MIFFYKSIRIKVTEQIVNPTMFSQLHLRFSKMRVNRIGKLQSDGCCNMQNATIVEPVILTGF